jgi:hypothetical protein
LAAVLPFDLPAQTTASQRLLPLIEINSLTALGFKAIA